jgi:hypothetical protein
LTRAAQNILLSRVARFRLTHQEGSVRKAGSGHIPITAEQWRAVLLEAALPEQWRSLRATALLVLSCRDLTPKAVGRKLPGWADEVCELWMGMSTTLGEVLRFAPPDDHLEELALADQLVSAAGLFGEGVLNCALGGWDPALWEEARQHGALADLTSTKAIPADPFIFVPGYRTDKHVYERSIGLSTEELTEGDGQTFTARLTAAWIRNQEGLDQRLRQQTTHLIDDSTTFTSSLRRHLVHLGASDFPLTSHRVAVATRDLLIGALKANEAGCLGVLLPYWDEEPTLRMAHMGVFKAYREIVAAEHDEHRLDSVINAYRYVMESDIRRSARVTLGLMSLLPTDSAARQSPAAPLERNLTLGPLLDLLRSHPQQPLCAALASTIKTAWRNPIGHCEVAWDGEQGTALLAGEPVDWQDLLAATEWARAVCRGFDHGIEVALAVAPLDEPFVRETVPESTRNLVICDAIGSTGVRLLALRRTPHHLTLTVRRITSRNIPDLLGAVLAAAPHAPEVDRWEIRQEGEALPLLVDRVWTEAALAQVGAAGTMLLPDDALLLMMNALLNAGIAPATAAYSVIECGARQVIGEADMVADRLGGGDPEAVRDVLLRVDHVRQAVRCAAMVLGFEVGSNMLRYFERQLAQVRDDVRAVQGTKIFRALQPIRDVLLARHIELPWPTD